MIYLFFIFTFSLCGAHHGQVWRSHDKDGAAHAPHHYRQHRPQSIDLNRVVKKLEPRENLSINIFNPPISPVPPLHPSLIISADKEEKKHIDTPRPVLATPPATRDNTKIKVALIGLSATVVSSTITAIIMWRTCSCQ